MNQFSDNGEDSSDEDELEEGLEGCDVNDADEIVDDELYCVACNKFFNSESAKLNHEASKKHKQNMELLKTEMNAEEENYQQKTVENDEHDSDAASIAADPAADESASEDQKEVEVEPVKKSKGKKSKKKNKKMVNYEDSESEQEKEEETKVEEVPVKVPVTEAKLEQDEDDDWSSSKKGKKTKTKAKPKSEKTKLVEPVKDEIAVETVVAPQPEESYDADASDHRCATCKQIFPSNNKLFAHLKKTSHSIYLGEEKAKTSEKPSSRKKK